MLSLILYGRDIKGGTWTKDFREHGAEEDIWTEGE
jgi:hypothetical protein